jgi:quinol monooxygenase YgiN
MIRHIVLVKFRAGVGEAQIAALFDDLHAIGARLPGCLAVTAGRSESPEQMERGYQHGFVADFTDWAALAAYQADPGHQAFGAALVAHAMGGIDGILVVDLPVGGST